MTSDIPEVFTGPARSCREDRAAGASTFLRLDDGGRLRLTSKLIGIAVDHEPYNEAAVAGALREAWEAEPYLDGVRFGSFFSAVSADPVLATDISMGEIAMDWGDLMMNARERRRLAKLAFPLTVFRGGVGDPRAVSGGVSWTTDLRVARFYATTWPARWGIEAPPCIVAFSVDRRDVAALFDARKECEILVPNGGPIDGSLELR